LAEPTDRGIDHAVGQLLEQIDIPLGLFHQMGRLGRANATGRALTARFVMEEAHRVERGLLGTIVV
jgi:superfamily II DNA/RNA helicase